MEMIKPRKPRRKVFRKNAPDGLGLIVYFGRWAIRITQGRDHEVCIVEPAHAREVADYLLRWADWMEERDEKRVE
jgi:hypothetical protein